MNKSFMYISGALSVTIFVITLNIYSWDLIKILLSSLSLTVTMITASYALWNKWLWRFFAKRQCKIVKRPYLRGKYNVEIIWSDDERSNKKITKVAEVMIKQDYDLIEIYYRSNSGESKSGYVDIVRTEFGYEINYHYYMKPISHDKLYSNPAHDGSAKITVIDNKIKQWEYFTNRGTKGKINLTGVM